MGLGYLVATASYAQDTSRTDELRDSVLEELGLDSLSTKTDPNGKLEVEGGDEVILPALKGLLLLPNQDQVNQLTIDSGQGGIDSRLENSPEDLAASLSQFLGEPLTLNLLAKVNRTINRVYREDDRPVVDAYLPEQDVSTGVVQLVVIEGRLGEIRAEGAERSNPEYLERQIRTQPGEILRESELAWDLDWLNDHPFRKVKLIFEPGDVDGTTDVVLQTADAKPLRLHAGIDNSGLELTGENQWNFGATWGRVFNTEHLAAYQYSTDLEFENLDAHSAFYRIPLPWRHRIDLIGAYVTSDASIPIEGGTVDLGGQSTLVGLDYIIPVRPRFFDLSRSEISLNADYKSTNSDLEFGGTNVFDETAAVLQFGLGWQGARPDKLGATGVGLTAMWSPGNAIGNNDDQSFSAQRSGSTSDYFYTELTIERLFKLPREWDLALTGTGQWSNTRLISTEQVLAGGYRTVRGFDENLIRGDEGVLGSVEFISPPFSVSEILGKSMEDEFNLIFFYDAAWLSAVDQGEDEEDQELSSLGLELKYRLGINWSMYAGYGWHLTTEGVPEVDGSGRMHFGATLRY